MLPISPPLHPLPGNCLVGREIFERGEQIGTKPSSNTLHLGKIVTLDQRRKKALGEIFCIMRVTAGTSGKNIKWPPIDVAEFIQSPPPNVFIRRLDVGHQSPPRFWKQPFGHFVGTVH
jgi:hypothetical protein